MNPLSKGVLVTALLAMLSTNAYAGTQVDEQRAKAGSQQPRLTVLYDAFGRASEMQKDWGYSALVEFGGRRILFDTGNDAATFANNVRAKGVDLTTIDFVIMSHRHSDHMGGLSYVLSVNPKVKIYAPKEGFGVFGSSLPSSFYRKAETLPAEMRYFDGAPPEIMKFGTAWQGANFELIDKTTEIAPGIHLIALVSDRPGTLELKELSLAIDTPEGMVLVVGCSHPGIDRIVEATSAINKRIHLIAGGLHLVLTPDGDISKIVTTLHDVYHVEWVAPGHCTGEPAFATLQQAFGDRYLYAGLGMVIGLGVNPRAALGRGPTFSMDQDDIRTYRNIMRRDLISFGRPNVHETGGSSK
jgi:7,8-dihydropterin-6-yl-methyl-4-(beta-D-ribofuranosyl)aminobenzene 5'-phosphate synthase